MFNSDSPVTWTANASGLELNPINTWWMMMGTTIGNVGAATLTMEKHGFGVAPTYSGTQIASVEGLAGVVPMRSTAAVINSVVSLQGPVHNNSNNFRVRYAPLLRAFVRTGSTPLTNIRIMHGFGAGNLQQENFGSGAIGSGGIRFSTVGPDPGWVGVTRSAAGVVNTTDLGMALAINSEYMLTLKISSTDVTFAVKNLTTDQSVQESVPSPFAITEVLGGELITGLITLNGVAKEYGITRLHFLYRDMEVNQDY